jgi:Tol biopolymer transport system component
MTRLKFLLAGACALILATASAAGAVQRSTFRVSEAVGGGDPTANSSWPSVSSDGRFIAFSSWASNLVNDDTNDASDVFVRDVLTRTTIRVSVTSNGTQANGSSFTPSISADGNLVAFQSDATNLVPGDTEGHSDIFVHVISTGVTSRVSQTPTGRGANEDSSEPAISANGAFVAFSSVATNLVSVPVNATGICCDIFVHNLASGRNRLGDPMMNGDGASDSFLPVLSASGRYLAFASWGCDIVADVGCLDQSNVYKRDMTTGAMTLVTRSYSGGLGLGCGANPAISADGMKVAFISDGNNLVPGDTNGAYDVFERDLTTGVTTRVSVTSQGRQTNGGLGRVTMSADGRLVAFQSDAWNLVPNDNNLVQDIFIHDLRSGKTRRVSLSSTGVEADAYSANAAISSNGNVVAFESDADNLIASDTNFTTDIFARSPA